MNYRVLSLVLGLCLLAMTGAWAQEKASSGPNRFPPTKVTFWPVPDSQVVVPGHIDAWPYPDSLDSTTAAPKQHRVVYEDDRIRLLEVTILAGEKEPLHGHKYPSVFAFDSVQPLLHDHTPDGKPVTINRGLLHNDFPACLSMGPQAPHSAQDDDTFPQHFYRLEFKKMYGKDIENVHWTRNGNTVVHN